MDTPAQLRETLLRYLLNELGDADREQIDVRLISDPEFHELFLEADYDLRDAYAAGELSVADRQRVARAFRLTGSSIPHAAGEQVTADFSEPPTAKVVPIRPAAWRSGPSGTRVWWLVAAVAIVGVSLGSLALRSREVAAPAAATQQAGLPVGAGQAATAPARQQGAPGAVISSPAPEKQHLEELSLATLLLSPGGSRSQSALALSLAPGVSTVRIEWPAPVDLGTTNHYQLEVLNDAGETGCRSTGAPHGGKRGVIRFTCVASSIPAGTDFVRIVKLPADPEAAPLFEETLAVRRDQHP